MKVINLERREGWETRMIAALNRAGKATYQRGVYDCITMVCDVINALTGVDLWPNWAGKYHDKKNAMILIAEAAGHQKPYLTNAVSRMLGREPVDVRHAQRGDVVEWIYNGEPHIGVALNTHAAMLTTNGLDFVPLRECAHTWRIG